MDIQEESSSGTSTDIFDSNSNNVLDEESVIKVNADNFEEEVLKSTQKVLVDFYADWCEPCNLLSPLVAEVAKEHSDVKFVKVDTDENEKLANQYGVVYIPTLVLIENGDVVNRSVGYIEKAEIENLIK
ncbi:MAG: thioredoxin [Clostridia bacterium]|nr:thioredoxin [Clostridia bacterium]